MLAHRVGKEIGVGIGDFLVRHMDHSPTAARARFFKECLSHPRRRSGVHLHRGVKDRRVQPACLIQLKKTRAVYQHTPIIKARSKLFDQGDALFPIVQIAGNSFRRRKGCRQCLRRLRRAPIVDHHMPTILPKSARNGCANPLGTAGDKDRRPHGI